MTGSGVSTMDRGLERCASCISKLGAPSMSRSSTVTHTNTPDTPFSPAWTMDSSETVTTQQSHIYTHPRSAGGSSCDRSSLSSHGSSGHSEYAVPRSTIHEPVDESSWYDRPKTIIGPIVPPKPSKPLCSTCGKPSELNFHQREDDKMNNFNMAPSRPPSNAECSDKSTLKKVIKPAITLPVESNEIVRCPCNSSNCNQKKNNLGPYENYDVPKSLVTSIKVSWLYSKLNMYKFI